MVYKIDYFRRTDAEMSIFNMPNELIIKNKKWDYNDFFVLPLIGLGIFFLTLDLKVLWIFIILFFGMAILWLYVAIKRMLDNKPKICIDETGIDLIYQNKKHPWSTISKAYIKTDSKTRFTHNGTTSHRYLYLHIETQTMRYQYALNEFQIDKAKLEKILDEFMQKGQP